MSKINNLFTAHYVFTYHFTPIGTKMLPASLGFSNLIYLGCCFYIFFVFILSCAHPIFTVELLFIVLYFIIFLVLTVSSLFDHNNFPQMGIDRLPCVH